MYVSVHARDLPGAALRRTDALEAHRRHLDAVPDDVILHLSGPLIEAGQMCGSLFVYEASGIDAVRDFTARDPMVLAGVYRQVEICEFDWRRGGPS